MIFIYVFAYVGLFNCSEVNAEIILRTCVSTSGRSTYYINLDTLTRSGEIRYKYMNQDIIYSAHLTKIDGNTIDGIAVFKKSNSGETRGNPFDFKYLILDRVFFELNVEAKCE